MTAPLPRRPRLITVEQAAGVLGLSKMSVYRLIHDGLIDGYRVGTRTIRADAASVDHYLADSRIIPGWDDE